MMKRAQYVINGITVRLMRLIIYAGHSRLPNRIYVDDTGTGSTIPHSKLVL
jgi:hypothetical protein